MGNKAWRPEEIEELRRCIERGLKDVDTADAVSRVLAYRRSPHSCYFYAVRYGLLSPNNTFWTSKPTGHGVVAKDEDDFERGPIAESADAKFKQAMERAGYTPQEPSRNPGTRSPVKIQPARDGRPSSASGWPV